LFPTKINRKNGVKYSILVLISNKTYNLKAVQKSTFIFVFFQIIPTVLSKI